MGIGRLRVGRLKLTLGIVGNAGKLGKLGKGILKSKVGIGRLRVGRLKATLGIVGNAGRLGKLGRGILKSKVGIGRLKDGRGGIEHLLMTLSLDRLSVPKEQPVVRCSPAQSEIPAENKHEYAPTMLLET